MSIRYNTFEEASQACQKLDPHPLSRHEYKSSYKQDVRLPPSPDYTYKDFYIKGGWPVFLGVSKYATFEEASEACQKLKVRPLTINAYQANQLYKQDPKLQSDPKSSYKDFEAKGGWPAFLGVSKYATFEEASEACQKLEPRPLNKTQYKHLFSQDICLHPNPPSAYEDFEEKGGWPVLLGVDTEKYSTFEEASSACQNLAHRPLSRNMYQVSFLYKQDPKLHSNPKALYKDFEEKGGWPAYLGVKV